MSRNLLLAVLFVMLTACSVKQSKQEHFFLDGYDHLVFKDTNGNSVSPSLFISANPVNGVRFYGIGDTTLTLYNTRDNEPYSGYIRTFDGRDYNLQGEFEDGKMFRLRYWYPSRRVGMDADYRKNRGSVWNRLGQLTISWTDKETYFINPSTQRIREIRTDTMTSYYDQKGNLTRYTVKTDTAFIQYYADGTPRYLFPYSEDSPRNGTVKRWHPNGELSVIGQYKNGKESGTWIRYDSLGNEVERETYSEN